MRRDPNTELLSLRYDVGLSAARNALVERATTPFVVLLDDDFVFDQRTDIAALLRVLEESPDQLDIVAGSLVLHEPADSEPYSYAEMLRISDDGTELQLRRGSLGPVSGFEDACSRHDIVLNFFVARTLSLRRVLWDADLKLGEHQDFFLRAKNSGLKVASCPSLAIAIHAQDHSDTNYKRKRMREFQFLRKMLTKHNLRRLRLSTGPVYVDLDR
eukprot:TRINITY_DN4070_c0_g1_i1.p1 TRINITY_DN4070_c0_g1~~TRINITY_DN4070_c0_g1_i1.p1  ORF type:complete len:215 (-),score=46.99 TRINITY_DN4070_c0_g1_i1:25-669(-)